MFKYIIGGALFLAATFSTIQMVQQGDSVTDLRWGAGLEVAQARGK